MLKNPLINALGAEVYILILVGVLNSFAKMSEGKGDNPFIIMPVMISLFTLSAAVMAYIFCLQPIQMYLDGKKKEAVNLFLKTVLYFGLLTTVLMTIAFGLLSK